MTSFGSIHSQSLVTTILLLQSSSLTSFSICASCASYTSLRKRLAGVSRVQPITWEYFEMLIINNQSLVTTILSLLCSSLTSFSICVSCASYTSLRRRLAGVSRVQGSRKNCVLICAHFSFSWRSSCCRSSSGRILDAFSYAR